MIKILRNSNLQVLFFILLVLIFSYFSFWRAFSFDFWGEDWEQIWFAVFDPSMINNVNEMQHPLVIYEELFLAKIFLFNTYYWQIAGFILKLLSALAVGLMMWGLTKSRVAAFFSGLISASAVGGLASFTWVAAHSSALEIPPLALGIYFWITSYKEFRTIKSKFILGLGLLIFSFWADPSRGFFGSIIVIFWEILSFIQHPQMLKSAKKRIFILIAALLSVFLIYQHFFDVNNTVSIGYNLGIVFGNLTGSLSNFLINIGNLLVGWIIPIEQNVFSISKANILGGLAGYFFLLITIIILVRFLSKKTDSLKILLILLVWIPIFFLPNWLLPNQEMIGNGQAIGMTHRYFTLSAVGLVCFLGYVISKVKKDLFKGALLLLVVGSNILMSNLILGRESNYRSVGITNPIWDKIEKDVPIDEEDSLFFIQGDDKMMINSISQAKIPFAVRRGIQSKDKWAHSSSDPGVIRRYLCGKTDEGKIIPLSHLHVWYIKGNTLENISEKARKEFTGADCNLF